MRDDHRLARTCVEFHKPIGSSKLLVPVLSALVLGLVCFSTTSDSQSSSSSSSSTQSSSSMTIENYGANVTLAPENCTVVTGNLTLIFMSSFEGKFGFMTNAAALSLAIRQAQSDGLIACWSVRYVFIIAGNLCYPRFSKPEIRNRSIDAFNIIRRYRIIRPHTLCTESYGEIHIVMQRYRCLNSLTYISTQKSTD